MLTGQPLDVLLAHDRWATTSIIAACGSLTEDKFHHVFEMGLGTLHDTITHILGAMRGWTDMLRESAYRPRLEGNRRSQAELLALHTDIADEFEQITRAHPINALATGSRGGRSYSFPRGAVVTHVTTHGMHHRAQCINMLRRLGVNPLPQSSVLEWMIVQQSN